MGVNRKRSRNTAGRPRGEVDPSSVAHALSLGDEVRETRDPEFAAERRNAKRRKMQEQGKSGRGSAAPDPDSDNDTENVAPARLSAKILGEARKQREEVREEVLDGIAAASAGVARAAVVRNKLENGNSAAADRGGESDSDEESTAGGDGRERPRDFAGADDDASVASVEVPEEDLTAADELALTMFAGDENLAGEGAEDVDLDANNAAGSGRVMLADIILAKIREKAEAEAAAEAAAADPEAAARDKKIAEVYGLVANIMARYKSGRIPKAFKIIPRQRNWEEIMYLTRPDEWSPAAVFAATRLFASNLTAKEVVTFYKDVLLPRVLQDIAEHKKLNYHLYRSLKKAVYKPDAFNKGILFPLCDSGGCSLREATIIGSVLSSVSMPMLHSAAALLYVARQPFALSNCVFIHTLLNKKYALPYRVIDALVEHFMRMKADPRPLPVVWHVSLLTFAQRYKTEMEAQQKEQLKLLMRAQTHPKVTPEIRRELFSARCRGDTMDPDANSIARAIANAL